MSTHSDLFSRLLVVILPPDADRLVHTRIYNELVREIEEDGGAGTIKWLIDAEGVGRIEVNDPTFLYVVADYAGHDDSPFATLLEKAMREARDFRPSAARRDRSRLLVFTKIHPRHWTTEPSQRVRRFTRHSGGNDLVPDYCIVTRN